VRILVLEDVSRSRLRRWLTGRATAPPTDLSAYWSGDPQGRPSTYPSYLVDAPVLHRTHLDLLGAELAPGGSFLPLTVEGADEEYVLYLVEHRVDCLDVQRSSSVRRTTGFVRHAVFVPERLPDLPAFRVPQSPAVVYWTRAAAERVAQVVGQDAEPLVVWSLDPELPAHPNPLRV
jgi:hypothetical protein